MQTPFRYSLLKQKPMFNPFASGKKIIPNFAGGIHPPAMKAQSVNVALRKLPLSDNFIIPLQQHQGAAGEIKVQQGDSVLKGQPLTKGNYLQVPVHAPTSGIITAIEPHVTAGTNPMALCIHLKPDGHDSASESWPVRDYQQQDPRELINRLHLAGIVGLGGAGFPTAKKLQSGLLHKTEILIINAAESEPYVTADERLIQEHADEILQGIHILMHILKPAQTIIGIENNKAQAIAALRLVLADSADIKLQLLPAKYPSGSTRQLTTMLTGREVPCGQHSSAVNVLTQNVSTTFAIKRAIIDGQPLTERVITLAGDGLTSPGNVWVRIGTPVRDLLDNAGFNPQCQHMLVMGGPLMGATFANTHVPVMKTSNCLLTIKQSATAMAAAEQPCIRCGLCADVCPANLLPQQLYWFSRGAEHEKARQHHLFDCLECGACAFVCPSAIPLVQYYQQEKATIRLQDEEHARAVAAKIRFEAKNARMEQEKQAREARYPLATRRVNPAKQTAVADEANTDSQQTEHQKITHDACTSGTLMPAAIEIPMTTCETLPEPACPQSSPYKEEVAMAVARIQARKAAPPIMKQEQKKGLPL